MTQEHEVCGFLETHNQNTGKTETEAERERISRCEPPELVVSGKTATQLTRWGRRGESESLDGSPSPSWHAVGHNFAWNVSRD